MATIRSLSRWFYFMNIPLRLLLVLFFVLSALNLPAIQPVKAVKALCSSDTSLVGCW